MQSANSCRRCGRPTFGAQSFCPACGEKLTPASKGSGFKLLLGVFAVFVLALWGSTFYALGSRSAAPPRPAANQLVGTTLPNAAPTLKLSDAQHLAEGKRALADGYSPSSDTKKATVGEVAAARWHLKAIAPSATEYREAQELLKEVTRRERQAEAAAKQVAAAARPTPELALPAEVEGDTEEEKEESALTSARHEAAPLPPLAQTPASRTGTSRTATAPVTGGSSSDYYTNVEGRQVRRPTFSDSGPPAGASAQCRDGSYSFSRNRRGTCSHHGGVARWL